MEYPSYSSQAGLKGRFTNHSGKASLTTQLYDARVDEQLIAERTGQRSVEALLDCKRTSDNLQHNVSSLLNAAVEAPTPKKSKPDHELHENVPEAKEGVLVLGTPLGSSSFISDTCQSVAENGPQLCE